ERFEELAIFFRRARIGVEIFVRPELQRVHEDADDDSVATLACRRNETAVPGVQIAHRRHERNALARVAPGANESTQVSGAYDRFHQARSALRAKASALKSNAPAPDKSFP